MNAARITQKPFLAPGLLLTLLLLILAGCGERSNINKNPLAEERAAKLLEAIKAEDYEKATAQYREGFFKVKPREMWVDELKRLAAERGPMQEFHLRRSQADTRFSGKFYILEYEAVHTGSKRVHHLITLRLPVEGGDMEIIGHKMTPWETDQ
jgi:hypothetical protein